MGREEVGEGVGVEKVKLRRQRKGGMNGGIVKRSIYIMYIFTSTYIYIYIP